MRRAIAALTLALPIAGAQAETVRVGPEDGFAKIEAARPGDTVLVAPGTYRFRVRLTARATADAPIVIRAEDPANPPVWDLGGRDLGSWPGSPGWPGEHGCFTIEGAHYIVSGIVVRGCRTDSHPVGAVLLEHAENVTLRDVVLVDSDQGIQGTGEDIVVEFSEIARNGETEGHNKTHNVYFTGGSLTLRGSYIHDSADGYNLKIDAHDALVEANWIARGSAGTLAMETMNDACGAPQRLVFRGNVVVGSRGRIQNEMVMRNSGAGPNLSMSFEALWNTFVVPDLDRLLVYVADDGMREARLLFSNNIVAGSRLPFALARPGRAASLVSGSHNWLEVGAKAAPLLGTVTGGSPGFVAAASHDFTLAPGSPARDAADPGAGPAPPALEYFRDETTVRRLRLRPSASDLGALQSSNTSPVFGPQDDRAPAPADLPDQVRRECRACGCSADPSAAEPALFAFVLGAIALARRTKPRS